jgi:hypothetical protein
MSQTLAPYNNAMRLGQGFNSYTQTVCVDSAVTRSVVLLTDESHEDDSTAQKESDYDDDDREKPEVSQIVSYSSRFVDKLSDVVGEHFAKAFPILLFLRIYRLNERLCFIVNKDQHHRRISIGFIYRQ